MMKLDLDNRAAAVVGDYLAAFYSADFDTARTLLADDFAFRGPFVQVLGRAAFFDSAAALRPIVRGCRVLRQWQQDGEVSSIFEVDLETPLGKGSVLMSEWSTVRDGQLVASRVVFDTAAFRALLPARASA